MDTGVPGQDSSRDDQQRFVLPDDVRPGRSLPKRTPPARRSGDNELIQSIAWAVVVFGVSLVSVSLFYGLFISRAFAEVVFENGATTALMALLIGCFSLPTPLRKALKPKQQLVACLAILAITPWTYLLGNHLDDAGNWMAPGLNFIFEVFLAVVVYRLLARRLPRSQTS